jgi:hypothetical protein
MFFQYSFTCPECSETIGPGTEMIVADNREAVPPEVYKKHPDCHRSKGTGCVGAMLYRGSPVIIEGSGVEVSARIFVMAREVPNS